MFLTSLLNCSFILKFLLDIFCHLHYLITVVSVQMDSCPVVSPAMHIDSIREGQHLALSQVNLSDQMLDKNTTQNIHLLHSHSLYSHVSVCR